jgi:hypothetical protein
MLSGFAKDLAANASIMLDAICARWKAEIQSSRRTEASAVAGVIPIDFRFVIAMALSPYPQGTQRWLDTARCKQPRWNASAEGTCK